MDANVQEAIETLDLRLKTLLPEEYRDAYEDVQPISMGSAALKFDVHGRVAWDQIWGSFCDLAMAGGPPHKGTLLEPAPKPISTRSSTATTKSLRRSAAASGS